MNRLRALTLATIALADSLAAHAHGVPNVNTASLEMIR